MCVCVCVKMCQGVMLPPSSASLFSLSPLARNRRTHPNMVAVEARETNEKFSNWLLLYVLKKSEGVTKLEPVTSFSISAKHALT